MLSCEERREKKLGSGFYSLLILPMREATQAPAEESLKPSAQEKTTHFPLRHPTPLTPRIAVQSTPSPSIEHPPQFSNSCVVSTHSYPPCNDGIGHAESESGQK